MSIDAIIELLGLFVAIVTFIITSRGERKATEEQTKRESIRATLTDFGDLRREHQDFSSLIVMPDKTETEKDELIKAYLADLERFAVGCNHNAYDVQTVNEMSGGMLVSQYRKYFKSYIEKRRRLLPLKSLTPPANLYSNVVDMIRQICSIRHEAFSEIEMIDEEERILERFLSMPISSTNEIFDVFRTLPGAVESHGSGKQGYLYVPGNRRDRCVLVAHADTVFDNEYKDNANHANTLIFEDGVYKGESTEVSIGADDRCGCAILWILRKSGHSLLLLDGEERGQVGAHYLKDTNPDLFKEINSHSFIIQFDRRGSNDYRCYDLPVTQEFKSYIEKETSFSMAEGNGKTDIIVLCKDICGVNLSVGYYDEHKPTERVEVEQWHSTLRKTKDMVFKPLTQYKLIEENQR